MSQLSLVEKQKLERIERLENRSLAKDLAVVRRGAHGYRYSALEKQLWLKKEEDYKESNSKESINDVMVEYGRTLNSPVPSDSTRRRWRKEIKDALDPNSARNDPNRIDRRSLILYPEAEEATYRIALESLEVDNCLTQADILRLLELTKENSNLTFSDYQRLVTRRDAGHDESGIASGGLCGGFMRRKGLGMVPFK